MARVLSLLIIAVVPGIGCTPTCPAGYALDMAIGRCVSTDAGVDAPPVDLGADAPSDSAEDAPLDQGLDAAASCYRDDGGPCNGVVSLALGQNHVCALREDHSIVCWGANERGELGDGTTVGPAVSPQSVVGLAGATQVSAAGANTCALVSGAVECWGDGASGQLGNGTTTSSSTPVFVHATTSGSVLSGADEIASGVGFACARTGATVVCWGDNSQGQLGDGSGGASGAQSSVPLAVVAPSGTGALSGVLQITAGIMHACARTATSVYCWGSNYDGQLGSGGAGSPQSRPVEVLGPGVSTSLGRVDEIGAGGFHTCARTGDSVVCWGLDSAAQLGDGNPGADGGVALRARPVGVVSGGSPLRGVSSIAAGSDHTCLVLAGGGMECFGDDGAGELGDDPPGGVVLRSAPVPVHGPDGASTLMDVVSAGAGQFLTCATTADHIPLCWGINDSAQLGIGAVGGSIGHPNYVSPPR